MYLQTPETESNAPNTQDIVANIALSNGNLPLAAERLHMTEPDILIALSNDPQALELLTRHLKMKVLMDTFKNLQFVSEVVISQTETSEYADDIKAMTAYSNLFVELTKQSPSSLMTTNVNVFERTMAMLPKDVRDSVSVLAAQDPVPIARGRPRRQLPSAEGDDD